MKQNNCNIYNFSNYSNENRQYSGTLNLRKYQDQTDLGCEKKYATLAWYRYVIELLNQFNVQL